MNIMIDPEEGWKYGFPKLLPEGVGNIYQWLWDNGYPQGKKPYYVRYYEVPDESDNL